MRRDTRTAVYNSFDVDILGDAVQLMSPKTGDPVSFDELGIRVSKFYVTIGRP